VNIAEPLIELFKRLQRRAFSLLSGAFAEELSIHDEILRILGRGFRRDWGIIHSDVP
jgi:hypothetical protein